MSAKLPDLYEGDDGQFLWTLSGHIGWCTSALTRELDKLDTVKFVAELRELFDEIDVNGDQDLEWSEFTGFAPPFTPLPLLSPSLVRVLTPASAHPVASATRALPLSVTLCL